MTIAQRFAELGESMGINMSDCHTGNIGEVLNMITQGKGGTVSDSQNIQLAMMNLTNTTGLGFAINPDHGGTPVPPGGFQIS